VKNAKQNAYKKLFKAMDKEEGLVSKDGLQKFYSKVSKDKIKEAIFEADTDGDGNLSLEEFMT
jgi:Ca2+-binding EF-hand superfamily protein